MVRLASLARHKYAARRDNFKYILERLSYPMVRSHIIFTGTVQGVGFRYTTQRYAANLSLTGWVKNLSDGSVELLCEGSREQIENLLYKLDKHFEGRIKTKDVDWLEAKRTFSAFDITY